MLLENFARALFQSRLKKISMFGSIPDEIQKKQLEFIISKAKDTEWGRKFDYKGIKSYPDYASRVPVQDYEDIKPYVLRMMRGEQNLLWPEKITWFAQSSGTTNDKSKFIPVSKTCLKKCHFLGPQDLVATYLMNFRDSKLFSGKGLILGGSRRPVEKGAHAMVGDLSAVLIENMNPIANLVRTPSKQIVLMDEWEEKLECLSEHTIRKNITSLSGVPSWFLVLFKKILEKTGKSSLLDVWPNLEVFFHGGVSFLPYRDQYQSIIPSDKMRYMETYNASEGFFAFQNDWLDPGMLLLLDYGIFYEFIPVEETESEFPVTVPLWEVEPDRNYALVVSSSNGLWRYKVGDTVRFTSTQPYKIVITGRTKHYINAFGEELMIDNAEKALIKACDETGAQVREYTAAPVYMSSQSKGRHQWLIEFEKMPDSLEKFTWALDNALKSLNSDYEAKRYKNMTLDLPEVNAARTDLFYDWLKYKGRLGGQHKIPRLSNTREYIESILSFEKGRS